MVYYRQFAKSDDVARNIAEALDYCRENREDALVFEPGEYRVKKDLASEAFYSISNHGDPALKRICFLLKDMKDFTVDGGGAHFIFEDIMIPVVIDGCENVKVCGFTFSSLNTQNGEGEIVDSGNGWFELKMKDEIPHYLYGNDLYFGDPAGEHHMGCFFVRINGKTNWYADGAGDDFFCDPRIPLHFFEGKNGTVRGEGAVGALPIGDHLVFLSCTRSVAGIFMTQSRNSKAQNVTFYTGIGMGVIAQNCDGVELDRFDVRNPAGRHYSINADATHFVHCKGKIHIHDCFFEGQLDDALNIHSIYLRIVAKRENSVIVRYMHCEARGIGILTAGSVVDACPADTLLPAGRYHVKEVRQLNLDNTEVFLEEGVEQLRVGDDLNEVSFKPDVLFEHCTVQNNRARGMLLAGNGRTVIRENLFRTPGTAIRFESDGEYWFEAGGVEDVQIVGNTFDDCVRGGWGRAVVEIMPRKKTEEGRYYHKKIAICDNLFRNSTVPCADINNVETFLFENNREENCTATGVKTVHCGNCPDTL